MNPVVVRNVKIGEGIPKICVPIVGITREEILESGKISALSEQMLLNGGQTGLRMYLFLKR